MINRALILLTVLIWYATIRMAIYHYFIPRVLLDNGKLGKVEEFDWWFSWLLAIPVTGLTIFISILAVGFVFGIGLFR